MEAGLVIYLTGREIKDRHKISGTRWHESTLGVVSPLNVIGYYAVIIKSPLQGDRLELKTNKLGTVNIKLAYFYLLTHKTTYGGLPPQNHLGKANTTYYDNLKTEWVLSIWNVAHAV